MGRFRTSLVRSTTSGSTQTCVSDRPVCSSIFPGRQSPPCLCKNFCGDRETLCRGELLSARRCIVLQIIPDLPEGRLPEANFRCHRAPIFQQVATVPETGDSGIL